jgi:rubrerythrin
MGSLFDATDIVQFAVRIEENGANFYRFAVQLTKDDDVKKIFERLAEEEVKHGKTFSQIFAAMEKSPPPPEMFDGEYGAYLRSYVDNAIIFKKEALDKELALVKDTVGALDFAIRRELDSITYYHEIKALLGAGNLDAVDKIIAEERKHYCILTDLKKQFAK